MENSRNIKSVMLGIMDGKGRCGRPNMEWIDNIKEWCNKDLYSLTIPALGLNRYSVRLLGLAEYLILGNTRYSVVKSLPIPSIKIFV